MKIKQGWEKTELSRDKVMMWIADTLAFFGFLWIGEMAISNKSAYDPDVHLSIHDVTFNHASSPTVMFSTIKSSRTDPFRKGVTLALGWTHCLHCPVAAMAAYLHMRGMKSGPLFVFSNKDPLSWSRICGSGKSRTDSYRNSAQLIQWP